MTENHRLTGPDDREHFMASLLLWCFKWGCEVSIRNLAQQAPVIDPMSPHAVGPFHERTRDGDLVDLAHRTNHKTIEMPELTFSRGDRHVRIAGTNWSDLMRAVEYRHRQIYMELSVPKMNYEPRPSRKE